MNKENTINNATTNENTLEAEQVNGIIPKDDGDEVIDSVEDISNYTDALEIIDRTEEALERINMYHAEKTGRYSLFLEIAVDRMRTTRMKLIKEMYYGVITETIKLIDELGDELEGEI